MGLASRRSIYLAGEDLNFVWDEADVLRFEEMWNQGMGLYEIADILERDPDEVAILVIDRARQGFIKQHKKKSRTTAGGKPIGLRGEI